MQPLTTPEQQLVLEAHQAEHTALERSELGNLYEGFGFNAATGKAQWVRIMDFFLIGPVMVAGGVALRRRGSTGWGTLLVLFGVVTSLYNGINWWVVNRALKAGQITEQGIAPDIAAVAAGAATSAPLPFVEGPTPQGTTPAPRVLHPADAAIYGGAAAVSNIPVSTGGSYRVN